MPEDIEIICPGEGGEATVATMSDHSRAEIGRKTFLFVRELMSDPETRAKIKARAEEIRAARYA